MFEKIIIKDFQSHRRLVVEFDPHLTVLTGRSDIGKSAVLRALVWLLTNQPRGDAFIRHGQDSTCISLDLDGHTVRRHKGKGVNSYQLDQGTPYEAFGTGVPDEIVNLLNLSPASMQRQMDAPFLFTLSPGEVARELNSVVNLDLIDSFLSNLAKNHRQAKTAVQVSEDRFDQAKQKKQDLAWVKDADQAYQDIEKLEQDIVQVQDDVNDLQSLVDGLADLDSRLHDNEKMIKEMELLVQDGNKLRKHQEEWDNLDDLIRQIDKLDKQIQTAAQDVFIREKDLKDRLDGRCPLCGSTSELHL